MVNSLYFWRGWPPTGQLVFPECNDTVAWEWSYNSLNQGPCEVATWLEYPCYNGVQTIIPLQPGNSYSGPLGSDPDTQSCQCNTAVYSLVSACAACQGYTWITWPQWSFNCSTYYRDSNYMYYNVIPDGTSVPYWAFLDVISAETWNATAAKDADDSLEITATGLSKIQGSSVSESATQTPSTASAVSHSPSSSPSSHRNKSHAGKIVPIVVGVIGAAMLIAVIFWCFRRRRRRLEEQPSPSVENEAHMAEAAGLPDSDPPMPIQYYDPSDPSTFPPPIVLPPIPAAQTTPSGEHGHGTEPTGTNNRTKYDGLPLI